MENRFFYFPPPNKKAQDSAQSHVMEYSSQTFDTALGNHHIQYFNRYLYFFDPNFTQFKSYQKEFATFFTTYFPSNASYQAKILFLFTHPDNHFRVFHSLWLQYYFCNDISLDEEEITPTTSFLKDKKPKIVQKTKNYSRLFMGRLYRRSSSSYFSYSLIFSFSS